MIDADAPSTQWARCSQQHAAGAGARGACAADRDLRRRPASERAALPTVRWSAPSWRTCARPGRARCARVRARGALGSGDPQYAPGHRQRVREARELVADLPRLELAGAAWDGVGVPDVARSGAEAAARLVQ